MKSYYLYKIVNTVNEKVYIGITYRPKDRLREHFSKSSTCRKLSRAIKKYGKDKFSMVILCEGLEDYVIDLEEKAIFLYDSIENGYNLMSGHPNKNGASHSTESKLRISEALFKYYSENVCANLGAIRLNTRDLQSYYVKGFWFPTKLVALKSLNMNEKSFYKWRKEGTLGDVCHPATNSKSHTPVYLLGFWFINLLEASVTLQKDKDFLLLLLRSNQFEQDLGKIGTKPRKKPKNINVGVNQRDNGTYRAILTVNKQKVLNKTFSNLQAALLAYDDASEEHYGDRPNKTQKGAIP